MKKTIFFFFLMFAFAIFVSGCGANQPPRISASVSNISPSMFQSNNVLVVSTGSAIGNNAIEAVSIASGGGVPNTVLITENQPKLYSASMAVAITDTVGVRIFGVDSAMGKFPTNIYQNLAVHYPNMNDITIGISTNVDTDAFRVLVINATGSTVDAWEYSQGQPKLPAGTFLSHTAKNLTPGMYTIYIGAIKVIETNNIHLDIINYHKITNVVI